MTLALLAALALARAGEPPPPPAASSAAIRMTLEDYVGRALAQGAQGRQAANAWESAGFARRIAMRQTDSPTLTSAFTGSLTETRAASPGAADTLTREKTGQTSLTLTEPLPTGTVLTLSGVRDHTLSRAGGVTETNSVAYEAEIVQPVYLTVQNPVRRTRKRAELQLDSARATLTQEQLAIRAQAAGLYFDVIQQAEAREVQARKAANSRQLLEVTKALVDAGKSAAVSMTRAQIALATDERQLQNVDVALETAILSAKNFISLPLETSVLFVSTPTLRPVPPDLEKLERFGLEHNPQLRQLRRSIELADFDIAQARETVRPTFSATGRYTWNRAWPDREKAWSAGVSANWLLFDSFVTRFQVKRALLAKHTASINLAAAELSLRVRVRSALRNLQNIEKQIEDFRRSREQARSNVDLTRFRFQAGLDRLIDVLDVYTVARDLDLEFLQLLIRYQRLKYQLSQDLGAEADAL